MEHAYTVIAIGAIIFLSYFFSKLFEKTRIPDVLPLFLLGIYIGPIAGLIALESIAGFAEIFAVLTITIILFVGGLKIDVVSLVRSFTRASLLMLLNLIGTVVIVTIAAYLFFGLHPLLAAIVGILVGGTSSAVVIPVAQALKITENTRTMLAVESNLNVIFSVVLAFSLWSVWNGASISYGAILGEIGTTFLFSLIIGLITAILWSRLIPLTRLFENNLFTTPAFLLIVFGTAELLSANGTLAVLAFGVTLGNLQNLHRSESRILKALGRFCITYNEEVFFSSLMFLFKTFFFVYMGIVIDIGNMSLLAWGAGVVLLLYALRFFISHALLSGKIPPFDLLVVKAMLPKGLVAGAVLVVLGAPQLEAIAYPIIFMSIIGTSIAIFFVQKWMPPNEPPEHEPLEDSQQKLQTRLLMD